MTRPATAAARVNTTASVSARAEAPALRRPRAVAMRASGDARRLLVLLTVAMVVVAPELAPHDPLAPLDPTTLVLRVPSPAHPFGTDALSRDVLARTLHATRGALLVAALAGGTAATTAAAVATLATATPRLGRVLLALADIVRALPQTLLLLGVAALAAPLPPPVLALLLGATAWPPLARLAHAELRRLSAAPWHDAVIGLGASPLRLATRHLLPHLAPTLAAGAALAAADAITADAALAFLGLGTPPPAPTLGGMAQEGLATLDAGWWVAAFPCAALAALAVAAAHLADALAAQRR